MKIIINLGTSIVIAAIVTFFFSVDSSAPPAVIFQFFGITVIAMIVLSMPNKEEK